MFGSFLVCCIGIRILLSKIKNQRLRKWRDRANSATPQTYDADLININNQEQSARSTSSVQVHGK